MNPLQQAIRRLADGESLSSIEAAAAFDVVMAGDGTPVQVAALLTALRVKGETPEEIAGAARALRNAMRPVTLDALEHVVDTCGTGGGQVGTLNVSTGAAFIVAGAGVPVAKHGNRSFTSRSGSADVLEALGVRVELEPHDVPRVLAEAGLAFLFAPGFHPAMRHAAPVRRELAMTTIMNLLGPLANPAGVLRQVLGVADRRRAPLLAEALRQLGCRHALVVHADVGMDEVSPEGCTHVWEVTSAGVQDWRLDPRELGVAGGGLGALAGGEPADNAARLEAILAGEEAGAARDALLLNAAAALYVSGRGWSLAQAMDEARRSLDSGAARRSLERLRRAAPKP
ncbi:MAG TPA: anthranilate phosphoribosyltransferase [Gemmatimonadales bacterium]|nr:anthranilate phosphoribosyltransferase [Gemmatimonadales bacterium]